MPGVQTDRELLVTITEKLKDTPKSAEFDANDNLIKLDLSNSQLSQLPPEIGQLSNLQQLRLANSQLSQLPLRSGS